MATAAKLHPQFITDKQGHKTGVILTMDEYIELMEDLHDLAALAERKDEPGISHKVVLKELKGHGLI
jgi:PHD/YefM family antitoxin component YafN of YafNO toxin-antitoxin module